MPLPLLRSVANPVEISIEQRIANIDSLPPLREIIALQGLSALKSLGQNFLLDMNITDKIVRSAQARYKGNWADIHAIEIGPGPGGLTRSLLRSGVRKVTAVEFDERAVIALQSLKEAAAGDLEIVQADALGLNLLDLATGPRIVVANLPYNIATPLLINWLKQIRADKQAYASMTLMFQKEVADRISARVNTDSYGRLAIIAQWICKTEKLFDLPPSAFIPPPKVTSAVVHFTPKEIGDGAPDFEMVERVTASAFNQRRKMIRSSLKQYLPAIEALGLDPQARAETLAVDDFLKIAAHSQM